MIRLAANLSMMFQEHDFLERFAAAAGAGFRGVEYLFPYAHGAEDIRQRLEVHGLTQVLFNLPPGDWDAGERGLASLPGREAEFRDGLDRALEYAAVLDCSRLHAMAGVLPAGADETVRQAHLQAYLGNLRHAAKACEQAGRTLLIEPINGRDMPGYFLQTQEMARQIVDEIASSHLKVQFDVYHCQIVQGDLIHNLEAQFSRIGHVQIAGVPERHEPDRGEVHYPAVLERLEALGYGGWVGCEYRPAGETLAGLGWGRAYGLEPGTPASDHSR